MYRQYTYNTEVTHALVLQIAFMQFVIPGLRELLLMLQHSQVRRKHYRFGLGETYKGTRHLRSETRQTRRGRGGHGLAERKAAWSASTMATLTEIGPDGVVQRGIQAEINRTNALYRGHIKRRQRSKPIVPRGV